jgi:hypothetical protein
VHSIRRAFRTLFRHGCYLSTESVILSTCCPQNRIAELDATDRIAAPDLLWPLPESLICPEDRSHRGRHGSPIKRPRSRSDRPSFRSRLIPKSGSGWKGLLLVSEPMSPVAPRARMMLPRRPPERDKGVGPICARIPDFSHWPTRARRCASGSIPRPKVCANGG